MAKATYVQPGNTIDFKNNTGREIAYQDVVVLKSCIGIAGNDIPIDAVGVLHLTGSWELPALGVIAVGEKVYWDPDNEVITAAYETSGDPDDPDPNAALIPAGIAATAKSGTAAGTVQVNLE